MKYFKTQGELIDHYLPNVITKVANNRTTHDSHWLMPVEKALIHAYELGAMHHSEDTNFELAEFDSNYEKETDND